MKDKKNYVYPRFEDKLKIRSQDLPKSFYDAGMFVIYPSRFIFDIQKEFNEKGYLGFLLPRNKAVDIDTQEDWDFAEALYNLKS